MARAVCVALGVALGLALGGTLCLPGPAARAQDSAEVSPPTDAETLWTGLEAWTRIAQVLQHPRCSNCHVGPDNIPLWSGPSYGTAPRPHGMNITGGDSRIGAEAVLCSTCHVTSDIPDPRPHSPPRVATDWQLAPVEMQWAGRASHKICAQLRDPDRNGGRDAAGLADHAAHDAFVAWGWVPGGGRAPAPFTQADFVADLRAWGAAGQPCPDP